MSIIGVKASANVKSFLFTPVGYAFMLGTLTSVNKLNMNAETMSTNSVTSKEDSFGGIAGNGGVAMYQFGTSTGSYQTNQKMLYPVETATTLANNLPQSRYQASAMSNSGTAAYIVGGAIPWSVRYKTIVKSPFSTDTPATLGNSFSDMGNVPGTCSNNHTAGYTFGGYSDSAAVPPLTQVNKITYSNDSISNTICSLPLPTFSSSVLSNDGTAAYCTGGRDETLNIYKVNYSTEARTTINATLTSNLINSVAVEKYQTAGYLIGGYTYPIGGESVSYIQKLNFSNETKTTISATLSTAGSNYITGGASNNGVI